MFLFYYNKKLARKSPQLGFSLIELMVTISIVTLVTGIVMVKYTSFNNVVILKSQAYELALDIRAAQVYGVNAKGVNSLFQGAYGIYFDISSSGNKNHYILFNDLNGNRKYDSGEEIGDTYTIDSRFEISQICSGISCTSANQAGIAFRRPDFDAYIVAGSAVGESQIDIVISSVQNSSLSRVVTVYSSGQISVQ